MTTPRKSCKSEIYKKNLNKVLYLIRGLALNITVELHENDCRSGQLRKKVVLRGHYYKFDKFTQKIIPVLILKCSLHQN